MSRRQWREKILARARDESGYTLMELLVVLAILSLLVGIAAPVTMHYLEVGKVKTAKTEVANISAALDLFKLDVGRYPTTNEGLAALVAAPASAENWNGPYVKKVGDIKDPWGHPYYYKAPGQHGEFDLFSYGSDGKQGEGGAKPSIANW